jgi:TRAP transporter TAXI family solute receptor
VIITQLEHAVEQVDLSRATMKGMITLGTGPAGGTYHAFGRALSRYANEHKSPLFPYPSVGSVQNASMVQNGSLDFGLVQSDVAQFLYQGSVPEGFYPNRNLRTVASLWPEAVHVVTLAGTGIRSMADLDNKRVAIGVRGSGSRVNAVLIGLKADLGGDNLPNIREIGLAQAIRELERGKIDAFFLTEAVPAPALQELASRRKDVRFVSIGEEFIAKLAAQHFAYYPMYIESRTYPNQTEPFQTLGLAAALITNANVPDKKVNNMLESLLEGAVDLSRKYYRAAFITRETMRLGIAVPLHPAAERFYDRYDARPPAEAAALDPAPAPRPDPG